MVAQDGKRKFIRCEWQRVRETDVGPELGLIWVAPKVARRWQFAKFLTLSGPKMRTGSGQRRKMAPLEESATAQTSMLEKRRCTRGKQFGYFNQTLM
jgi:hypothetical protein